MPNCVSWQELGADRQDSEALLLHRRNNESARPARLTGRYACHRRLAFARAVGTEPVRPDF